jgi:hypothetical protein
LDLICLPFTLMPFTAGAGVAWATMGEAEAALGIDLARRLSGWRWSKGKALDNNHK